MRKILPVLISIFIIFISSSTFSQERYGAFTTNSFGCESADICADISFYRSQPNVKIFLDRLNDSNSKGECRKFSRGNGFLFLNEVGRRMRGYNLIRVKALSDGKEYWVPLQDTTPVGIHALEFENYQYWIFIRDSFACKLKNVTQRLAWVRDTNENQFEIDLKRYIKNGECRSCKPGLKIFPTYGTPIVGINGYNLVEVYIAHHRINYWVPQQDIKGIKEVFKMD